LIDPFSGDKKTDCRIEIPLFAAFFIFSRYLRHIYALARWTGLHRPTRDAIFHPRPGWKALRQRETEYPRCLTLETEAFFCGLTGAKLSARSYQRTGSIVLNRKDKTGRNRIVPALLIALIATLVSLFIITSALASPTGADDVSDLETRSTELNDSYNQALQELVALDTEIGRREAEIDAVRDRSSETAAAIAAQEQHLAELQQQLAGRQTVLEKRLTSAYKSDDMGYIEVVMGAGDFSEFLSRVDMVNKIAEEDQKLIDSYRETRDSIEKELASLAAKRDELAALEGELSSAGQELLAAQAEQQSYVSSLEGQMAANAGQLEQLRAEAAQIDQVAGAWEAWLARARQAGG